ncbi:tyrosine-type recombinase/integrase [Nannocystis punicea]|uniref:Tyrosine-type recombinase/integrase n=1 Tax=Nannocystis punicea TaxID=2995304 RepID=A0ABY7GUA6_9BACT|nr:site-specific integrase [Nannocystis poenicansa]WAS90520.1 tyrosine-type recombinase/integrase [Nannocystis poenicansa]
MWNINVIARATSAGRTYWQYDFRIELPDGTPYRERRKARGATSEAAARQVGMRRLQEVLRQGPKAKRKPETDMPTVAEFAKEWLELCTAERQRPATLENKHFALKKHILPILGATRLDAVDDRAIARFKRERQGVAAATVNNSLKFIGAMLRCAKEQGHRVQVPSLKRLPEEHEARWYTSAEYLKLIRSAETYGPTELVLVLLAGDAGLRAGEISALRWEDIDFINRILTVKRNLVRKHEGPPKGKRERKIPISGRLDAALRALHRRAEYPRVFTLPDGRDVASSVLRGWFAKIATYAEVPCHGLHALRHSFGSRLMLSGAGAQVVMELLGHTHLRTTQIYVHAEADHRRSAIDRMMLLDES